MRIAAVSDIHGNLFALDAVLADIERRGVDRIVNLGDIVSGPLLPRETAERLMALGLPTIRGNHERQVLTLDPVRMGPSDRYAFDTLGDEERRWLAALPSVLSIEGDIFLCQRPPETMWIAISRIWWSANCARRRFGGSRRERPGSRLR